MKKIILIKLGGSLITDKETPYKVRKEVINKIVDEFAQIVQQNKDTRFLLGNGAGSFGHYPATLYKSKRNSAEGFAVIQNSVEKLNRIVVNELLDQKISACSLHSSTFLVSSNGKKNKMFTESLFGSLDLGLTPVVYGDIVYDYQLGSHIFSTENLFSLLIPDLLKKNYKIEKIIHLTRVDGVLDQNGNVISVINSSNFNEVKKQLYFTKGFDVTGGMLHKIVESLSYVKEGIKTIIIRGDASDQRFSNAILNKKFIGTIVKS